MLDSNFWSKTIFSLFEEDLVQDLNLEKFIKQVQPGDILIGEGQLFDELHIPISTSISLATHNGIDQYSYLGTITLGRSVGLFSYLRCLPASYTFIVKEAGQIISVPRKVLDDLFLKSPGVKRYLLNVTKNPSFRSFAQEFRELGISNSFIVNFVGSLSECTLQPQSYLVKKDSFLVGPIFLIEGQFLIRPASSQLKSSVAPMRSWLGWKESIEGFAYQNVIKSTSKSVYFQIKTSELLSLKESYPKDFEIIDKWIRQIEIQQFQIESSSEESSQSENLFSKESERKAIKWNLPFVSQPNNADSGSACLAMISQFYGKSISMQVWRSQLANDRVGTNLLDLAKSAEKQGFVAHCLEIKDIKKIDSFLLPFMAFRKNRYCLVYEIKRDVILVGDPAIGLHEMNFIEFSDCLDQVGIFLSPNTEFLNQPTITSPWKHYLQLFKGLERDLSSAFICGFLIVVLSLVPPMVGQIIIDNVLVRGNIELLWILLAISGTATLISLFISWAQGYYFNFIVSKFNFRTNTVFIQKMFSLPYGFFATRHSGDFTHRLAEMSHVRSFLTKTLFEFISNVFTIVIYGAALFFINIKLAIGTLLLAPPIMLAPLFFSKYMGRLYSAAFAKAAEQSSYVTDLVKGISTIKSSGAETTARTRFEERLVDLINLKNVFSMTAVKVGITSLGYYQLVNLLVTGLTVFWGIRGEMSAGRVVSFALLTNQIFGPLLSITKQWDQFIEVKSVLQRLNDIFLTPSEAKGLGNSNPAIERQIFKGEIEFRDVWFKYEGEASEWILKGLNFKIEAGQKIAIVGPSGSGKSTLAFLLTRMYEPTRGTILIDGRDYRDYDLNWLREQVGLLPQESKLFAGTIADNIGFNSLVIDEGKLKAAALRSVSAEFISKKGLGFGHFIPHGGHGFSVGQKQRLSLARLFYQNPSIVVLDEATSALDGISEREVLANIAKEMKHQTVINIAHRYSTVTKSEAAIVLYQGRNVGFGRLDQLKENNLIFRKLFGFDQNIGTVVALRSS